MRKDVGAFLLANSLGGELGNEKGHTVTALKEMTYKNFGVKLESKEIYDFLAGHDAKPVSLETEIDSRALSDNWSYGKAASNANIKICKRCGARFTIVKGSRKRELCRPCAERLNCGNIKSGKTVIRSDGRKYVSIRSAALCNEVAPGTIKRAILKGTKVNGYRFKELEVKTTDE